VRIKCFRNHHDSHLEFGGGMNVLLGGNGEGKTNVLEAISYLGLGKSFYAANDATALKIGEESFEIEGMITMQSGIGQRVRICYHAPTAEKEILVNRVALEKLNMIVGRFPQVLLSPESIGMISGPPGDRRKFLDIVLSQQSRSYFEDLLEYRHVLKQRNRLLLDARETGRINDQLRSSWTESLVRLGGRIVHRRIAFVELLRPILARTYELISGHKEVVDVCYRTIPDVKVDVDLPVVTAALEAEFAQCSSEEIRRGMTLVGPHRDELAFSLDGRSVQAYASQGQQKTLLLALKLAEFKHLSDGGSEDPLLLLDDLFGELDAERSERIINVVSGLGQSIITTTAGNVFRESVRWNGQNRRFAVENGTCRPC
jgi:DNA replication and repair protein RecF